MRPEPARILRQLILSLWTTGILSVALDLALESTLPEPIRAFREAEFHRDPTAVEMAGVVLGLAALGLLIRASYLLYRLRLEARRLFLQGIVLSIAVTPFFGPFTMNEWAMVLYEVSIVLGGVLVGWLYLAPPDLDALPSIERRGSGPPANDLSRPPEPGSDAGADLR